MLAGLLIVTALLLYYAPTPELHEIASWAHQAIEVVCVIVIVRHISA